MPTVSAKTRDTAAAARLRTSRIGIAQIAPRLGDLTAKPGDSDYDYQIQQRVARVHGAPYRRVRAFVIL